MKNPMVWFAFLSLVTALSAIGSAFTLIATAKNENGFVCGVSYARISRSKLTEGCLRYAEQAEKEWPQVSEFSKDGWGK